MNLQPHNNEFDSSIGKIFLIFWWNVFLDLTDDENYLPLKNQCENKKETKKDVKLINFKNLPSVFYVLSLIILSIMIVKFYPKFSINSPKVIQIIYS